MNFCKSASTPANRSKPEVEARIEAFLQGLPLPKSKNKETLEDDWQDLF